MSPQLNSFHHLYRYFTHSRYNNTENWQRALSEFNHPEFQSLVNQQRLDPKKFKYGKYLSTKKWFRRTFRNLLLLDFHKKPSQKILDLGSGACYFLIMARAFGHEVYGVDRPDIELYDKISELFHISRFYSRIESGKKIKDISESDFDLITSFMCCFYKHDNGVWESDDWDYFLQDIITYLNPGGRLFLSLNKFNKNHKIPPTVLNLLTGKYNAQIELSPIFREIMITKQS
jgi:SAM-dependent methyltransferase